MSEADEAFRKRIQFCLSEAETYLDEARSGEVQFSRTDPDGKRVDLLPERIAHLERSVSTYKAILARIAERTTKGGL